MYAGMYIGLINGAKDWEYPIGVIFGAFVYVWITKIFNFFMYITLKCEALGTFDAVFLLDDRKNLSNILSCAFWEPMDFESTK